MPKWTLRDTGDPYLQIYLNGERRGDAGPAPIIEELVLDANRGAESAAYDKAITAAGDRATDEAFKLTPAALAHGLVRDAIGVLVGDPIPVGGSPYHGLATTVRTLGKALETLGSWLVYEQVTRGLRKPPSSRGEAVPPQPIEQAIAEAHGGLTAEGAEE